jgi:hypothetical protein
MCPARRAPSVLAFLIPLLAAACASSGGETTPRVSSRSAITQEEIGSRASLDLYTLVQQLRPNWLRARGQATPAGGVRTVAVSIDGTLQPGGLEILRTLRGSQVTVIRFLSGQDATTRYGLDVEAGVIEVRTGTARD